MRRVSELERVPVPELSSDLVLHVGFMVAASGHAPSLIVMRRVSTLWRDAVQSGRLWEIAVLAQYPSLRSMVSTSTVDVDYARLLQQLLAPGRRHRWTKETAQSKLPARRERGPAVVLPPFEIKPLSASEQPAPSQSAPLLALAAPPSSGGPRAPRNRALR